jgi:hypothetical protein
MTGVRGTGVSWLHDPDLLWHSTRFGREEYVQRLLATLVLGEPARGWNVPREPSARGADFLRRLHASRFDDTPTENPIFVDEFELPARHDDERAGWPDHAVRWPDRLFLIELKSERSSHRCDQLPHYLTLADHHHPDRKIELLYLTPTMDVTPPVTHPASTTYAHTAWAEVGPLIEEVWGASETAWERTVADRLAWWIDQMEQGAPLLERKQVPVQQAPTPEELVPGPTVAAPGSGDDVDDALKLAALVQQDGKQRALEAALGDPEDFEDFRVELRDLLLDGPVVDGTRITHVRPWLWRAATTDGQPLTQSGVETGYEIRLSRSTKAQA